MKSCAISTRRKTTCGRTVSNFSFASVYDTLYGGDGPFLQTQLAFFDSIFDASAGILLDAGCGTGKHLAALAAAGYRIVGLDSDRLMLGVARQKTPGALVRGDLRQLPFHRAFCGVLCLESPLAYLLDDADLLAALGSIHGALCDHGKLVIDVYDYLAMLGTRRIRPVEGSYGSGEMRVTVRESHRYQPKTRIWTMRQEFKVAEADAWSEFEVTHRLRMRTLDEYAQALARAGFTVLEALTSYPNAPAGLRDERRLILVARR